MGHLLIPAVVLTMFFDSQLFSRRRFSLCYRQPRHKGPKCASILLQFKTLIRNRLQIVCARKQHDPATIRYARSRPLPYEMNRESEWSEAVRLGLGRGHGQRQRKGQGSLVVYWSQATKCVHINFIYLRRVGSTIAALGSLHTWASSILRDLTIQSGCCWWSNLATIVVVVAVCLPFGSPGLGGARQR